MPTKFQIDDIPSFRGLRIYLACCSLLAASAFVIPIQLSQTFAGTISSNGPTTELQSAGEANIVKVPLENHLLDKNAILFLFSEPRFSNDLELLKSKEKGLNDEFNEITSQCTQRISGLEKRLANARFGYSLYNTAFKKQAVSQVALLEYQDKMDEAALQLESEQASCEEKLLINRNEHRLTKKEIDKQVSQTLFDRELRAPDRGTVHSMLVKVGQRVSKGQPLAQFTALGTAGAVLRIPLEDRPFISIGSEYTVYSKAYAFLVRQPERQCRITSITPDVSLEDGRPSVSARPSYAALCQFGLAPMNSPYPLLVGMEVEAHGARVHASLMQLLLKGYRELTARSTDAVETGTAIKN